MYRTATQIHSQQSHLFNANATHTFFGTDQAQMSPQQIHQTVEPFRGTYEAGETLTLEVPMKGDMLMDAVINLGIPSLTIRANSNYRWPVVDNEGVNVTSGTVSVRLAPWFGFTAVHNIDIYIGDQQVDRLYGRWMAIWASLSGSSKGANIAEIVGQNTPDTTGPSITEAGEIKLSYKSKVQPGVAAGITSTAAFDPDNSWKQYETVSSTIVTEPTVARVPLDFWFCGRSELAIPLTAIQSSPVRFSLTLSPAAALGHVLTTVSGPSGITLDPIVQNTQTGTSLIDTTKSVSSSIGGSPFTSFSFSEVSATLTFANLGAHERSIMKRTPINHVITRNHAHTHRFRASAEGEVIEIPNPAGVFAIYWVAQTSSARTYTPSDTFTTETPWAPLYHCYHTYYDPVTGRAPLGHAFLEHFVAGGRTRPLIQSYEVDFMASTVHQASETAEYSMIKAHNTGGVRGLNGYVFAVDPTDYASPSGSITTTQSSFAFTLNMLPHTDALETYYVYFYTKSYNTITYSGGQASFAFTI